MQYKLETSNTKRTYKSKQREQAPLNKPKQDKLAKQKIKGIDSLE